MSNKGVALMCVQLSGTERAQMIMLTIGLGGMIILELEWTIDNDTLFARMLVSFSFKLETLEKKKENSLLPQ